MRGKIITAIHQPNFFPWLSFFDKIIRSDVFIVLDNVQMQKKGGTWQNRVRILVGREPGFITVPIDRAYHGLRKINETEIDNSKPWRNKILKTIEHNYGRTPYFDYAFDIIRELLSYEDPNLSCFNIHSIRKISEEIGIDTVKFVLASTLRGDGTSTDLLISLLKQVEADAYIYGKGAVNYQQDDKFKQAGIELVPQDFKHPVYSQCGTEGFVPALSIIDALMNLGREGTRKLLKQQ